jgi:hypothetical protein
MARGDGLAAVPDGPFVTDVSVVHPASQTYATEAARVTGAAACYGTTLIFLEYEIVAMGRRSMNVDVAVMR